MKQTCVVLLALVVAVVAYKSGAPDSACGDMVPQHGKDAQNSPSPYGIKLSSTSIKPNGRVFGTYTSPGDFNARVFPRYVVLACRPLAFLSSILEGFDVKRCVQMTFIKTFYMSLLKTYLNKTKL